jgi:hypothetical protein
MTVEHATDLAFFQKYRRLAPALKDKIRRMADLLIESEERS